MKRLTGERPKAVIPPIAKGNRATGPLLALLLAFTLSLSADPASGKPSGMEDIDTIREAVRTEATDAGNAESRRAALLL